MLEYVSCDFGCKALKDSDLQLYVTPQAPPWPSTSNDHSQSMDMTPYSLIGLGNPLNPYCLGIPIRKSEDGYNYSYVSKPIDLPMTPIDHFAFTDSILSQLFEKHTQVSPGKLIKQAREKASIAQAALARYAKIRLGVLVRIEAGLATSIRNFSIKRLLYKLKIDVSLFMNALSLEKHMQEKIDRFHKSPASQHRAPNEIEDNRNIDSEKRIHFIKDSTCQAITYSHFFFSQTDADDYPVST